RRGEGWVGVRSGCFALEDRTRCGRVLVVARRVDREVSGARRVGFEVVVVDETNELRARDRGLGGLDGVQDGGRFERIVGRPRLYASPRLGCGIMVERRVDSGSKVVPEIEVGCLLRGVLCGAPDRGGSREREDGMAILTRVIRELVTSQFAAFPTQVERMSQDVPALAGAVYPIEELQLCSPPVRR